jgi:hypothetical protein
MMGHVLVGGRRVQAMRNMKLKLFLATLSGFVFTLAIFAAGAISAIYFTQAEPVPIWQADEESPRTSKPIAASVQPFERLPARVSSATSAPAKETKPPPVDWMTTGALPDQKASTPPAPKPDEAATTAHVQWCSDRFRSYRPEDNSYRSYSGSQRECVSPFIETVSTSEDEQHDYANPTIDRPSVGHAVNEEEPTPYLTSRHIASCFARYRSYRPEDNSYQPYGGGSRRQCE